MVPKKRRTLHGAVPSSGGNVIPIQVELNGSCLGAFGVGVLA